MNRFSTGGELEYRFVPPRPSRFWNWVMAHYRRRLIRQEHNVEEFGFEELDRLRRLLGTDARILIAPNHCDHADGLILFELAEKIGSMFCYMATHQLFEGSLGLRYWIFPRCGIFPIDREGTALAALKAAKDVLVNMVDHPLVVYPEGEVYHTNDRLTPLREGAALMALTAQKKLKGKAPVYIVPVALKYRYLEPELAMERLSKKLDRLENRFTWTARLDESLPRRIYRLASGLLALKEVEFLGSPSSGTVPKRVEALREKILIRLENRYRKRVGVGDLPERINAVHRRILDVIKKGNGADEDRAACRRDLDVLFFVLQLFSYPGDYIQECPTVERIAETLIKFEQDLGEVEGYPVPVSARRLTLRIGEPIDMRDYLAEKSRVAVPKCTDELFKRMQKALDELGRGTHVKELKS